VPPVEAERGSIASLTPRVGGQQFVLYGDACSGVPSAPHERTFAAINAVIRRLVPPPEFIIFPGGGFACALAPTNAASRMVFSMGRYKFFHHRRHVVIGVTGALLMGFVIFGSVYPVPPYRYNWLPYLFAVYMLVGVAGSGYLKLRAPDVLATMEHDMEGV
jgi:hypothetical protein